MNRIKSAFEKAMERADRLGDPTPEDRLRIKNRPDGERLAVEYLKNRADLTTTIEGCSPEAKQYVVQGAFEVLVHNLRLPRTEEEQQYNKRVLQGLRILKSDQPTVDEITSQIENICSTFCLYYEQGLAQIYQETKQRFELSLQESLKRYPGTIPNNMNMNVESMPQFQQEWARTAANFTSQYQDPLNDHKSQLRTML